MGPVAPVTAIADVLAARGLGGWLTPPLRPMVAAAEPIAGPAVTIALRAEPAGRGMAELHALLSTDLTGAVVVIGGAGSVGGAVWGEILSRAAHRAGAAAVIVEGSVRDRRAMAAEGLPVYGIDERVVGPAGRVSVASVDAEVSIAGVRIAPGDTVVVDDCGVVRVEAGVAASVLDDAALYAEAELAVLKDLASGLRLTEAYRHKRATVEWLNEGAGR
ncbi:MAG TPA: hypothetical protein VGQ20_17825 [Acidimicrobiales bacterium]|jgi:regulator of RNase E activity RraA|nr:hypothetical protein [Acidimicrobiales bacterium]